MDAEGNICSMVHTANAFPWGSGIFVEGSALPNSAAIQPAITILATPPGGRVASPTQPILFVSESVKTAISTIGSGLHPYTVQLIPRLFNWMTSPKAGADGSFYGVPDYINNVHSHLMLSLCLALSLSRSHTRTLTHALTLTQILLSHTHTLSRPTKANGLDCWFGFIPLRDVADSPTDGTATHCHSTNATRPGRFPCCYPCHPIRRNAEYDWRRYSRRQWLC